ncbi:MAG: hypothetical protein JW863_17400 [Chitinispirillaceae bacterium]|nr:hypothetical protein [Chitinispirillaceae bacterium]
MKLFRFISAGCCISIAVAFLAVSCGKKGPSIEERIQTLQDKGTPDSVLANVKVYLYQYNSAKKMSQAGKARSYKDSLQNGIVAAEAWYEQAMATNKPIIDQLRKSFVDRKEGLSGLPLKDADSLLKIADSLIGQNWLVQARTKLEQFDQVMNILVENETKAKDIRKKIIGTWKDVHTLSSPDDSPKKFSAKEIRFFTFKNDGSFESSEECKGQTDIIRKEDWQFLSYGTFDLMGDTIYQFIDREKCTRQIYTFLDPKTMKWKTPEVKPTYDSTITNGSKDRFIVYSDLKLEFKKIR